MFQCLHAAGQVGDPATQFGNLSQQRVADFRSSVGSHSVKDAREMIAGPTQATREVFERPPITTTGTIVVLKLADRGLAYTRLGS